MSSFRLSRAILAAGAVIVGVILFLRPFGSLTALAVTLGIALAIIGVGEIMRGREHSSPTSGAAGCLILGAAMVTAAWPGLPVTGVGASTDVLEASAKAYVNAMSEIARRAEAESSK